MTARNERFDARPADVLPDAEWQADPEYIVTASLTGRDAAWLLGSYGSFEAQPAATSAADLLIAVGEA